VSFKPVYDVHIPDGFTGSMEYAWQMASMTTPVSELVSEAFTIDDVHMMHLLSTGLLRTDVELTIEEVDPTGRNRTSAASVAMTMARADEKYPDKVERATYYLTGGEHKRYRLRLSYTGRRGLVFREDLDIDPEEETFSKMTTEPIRIIDLTRRQTATLGPSTQLQIYPNPTSDRVSIIVGGGNLTVANVRTGTLHMDIVTAAGETVMTSPVLLGEVVDVQGLPSGVYAVRIRQVEQWGSHNQASGLFVVVD